MRCGALCQSEKGLWSAWDLSFPYLLDPGGQFLSSPNFLPWKGTWELTADKS